MNRLELEERMKRFHVDVITLCRNLPRDIAAYETARQLIRSAGSVSANYRASKRAKSTADFLHKIEIALEEADESQYWLVILKDAGITNDARIDILIKEANELTAILAATDKTVKQNNTK